MGEGIVALCDEAPWIIRNDEVHGGRACGVSVRLRHSRAMTRV